MALSVNVAPPSHSSIAVAQHFQEATNALQKLVNIKSLLSHDLRTQSSYDAAIDDLFNRLSQIQNDVVVQLLANQVDVVVVPRLSASSIAER